MLRSLADQEVQEIVIILILVGILWLIGWISFVIIQEPDNTSDGMFVLFFGFIIWPFYLLGWIVSRPFQ